MKKFEYTYCRKFSELEYLGKQGWELVCVDDANFYLKREL